MRLSVDNINLASPYWVVQVDDMTFRFVTKNDFITKAPQLYQVDAKP